MIASSELVSLDATTSNGNGLKPSTILTIARGIAGIVFGFIFASLGGAGMGPATRIVFDNHSLQGRILMTTSANRLITATFMTSSTMLLSLANLLSWGGSFSFLVASINLAIWILAWRFLPETKGKKLEDTSAYFQDL
jgi:hypothetical protein